MMRKLVIRTLAVVLLFTMAAMAADTEKKVTERLGI